MEYKLVFRIDDNIVGLFHDLEDWSYICIINELPVRRRAVAIYKVRSRLGYAPIEVGLSIRQASVMTK